MPATTYFKASDRVFPLSALVWADFSEIEMLRVVVQLADGEKVEARGIDALELAMCTKPAVLEGKRLRWARWAWLVHNLIGHPLMQVLAAVKAYRWAFYVHDKTVPKPLGAKVAKES